MTQPTKTRKTVPVQAGAGESLTNVSERVALLAGEDAGRAPHLLIVEDDPSASFVMSAALNFGGFTSEVVGTAIEALRRTGQQRYDLILIDLGLPDLDGGQLISTLKFHNDVPIIIVSGRASEQDKVAGLDVGADDFVAKPYSPHELLARIRAVLRRARTAPVDNGAINVAE